VRSGDFTQISRYIFQILTDQHGSKDFAVLVRHWPADKKDLDLLLTKLNGMHSGLLIAFCVISHLFWINAKDRAHEGP
jgi:hypothetical protein